ncbi:MAG: DUF4837 family protein [Bacteroidales bacterium]|nr:DUF4837 family protein [Bacteroidales bacterium]
MKRISIFVVGLFVLCSVACHRSNSQGNALVSSSGRSGEIVVISTDAIWQSDLGDSLRAILSQPLVQLPQPEPMFNLLHVTEQNFTGSYKRQRNILQIVVDSAVNSAKITVKYNLWAEPQLVVRIAGKSEQEAIAQLSANAQTVINYFLKIELQRFEKAQKSRQDFRLNAIVKQNYKLDIITPEGFFFAVQNEDFAWLRKETKDWGQDLMIYSEEYTDTAQFSNEYIINLRDQKTKQYVFGSVDSSFVAVERKIPSQTSVIQTNAPYAVKTEGVWKTVGDFMGGPFVSYTMLDTSKNRIVTVDAFLYAPRDKKRDLLRQLEAILNVIEFVNVPQTEK